MRGQRPLAELLPEISLLIQAAPIGAFQMGEMLRNSLGNLALFNRTHVRSATKKFLDWHLEQRNLAKLGYSWLWKDQPQIIRVRLDRWNKAFPKFWQEYWHVLAADKDGPKQELLYYRTHNVEKFLIRDQQTGIGWARARLHYLERQLLKIITHDQYFALKKDANEKRAKFYRTQKTWQEKAW